MHFTDAGVEEFLTIFNTYKNDIQKSEGCTHLELLKDVHESNTYTTLSYWNDDADLERYRKSELFGTVWGQVKTLFRERSQAFSLEKFIEV